MNAQEYFEFHKEMCDKARAISQAKNNDYSAPSERGNDPFAVFANFMQAERLNICSVEQGFMVRISDKLSRLCNLLRPGHRQAVADESVTDTALDTINYLILLLGYLETKREQEPKIDPVVKWAREQQRLADAAERAKNDAEHLDTALTAAEDMPYPDWKVFSKEFSSAHKEDAHDTGN